jgi:3-phenylpropionate/trans-cinnamate dioxygenase ferredoxin subunit
MYNYKNLSEDKCEFVSIGKIEDLKPGERMFVEIDELPIVVFNIADQFFAIADICSHDDGPVGDGDLEGFEITCPRHGARFDVRDGKAKSLPAIVDIPAYPTRIINGQIELGLPLDG